MKRMINPKTAYYDKINVASIGRKEAVWGEYSTQNFVGNKKIYLHIRAYGIEITIL